MQNTQDFSDDNLDYLKSSIKLSALNIDLAVHALELIWENSITQVVVLEGESYAGIIHFHELTREGLV